LAKFAAGDVNTGGKFATVVDDTVAVPRLAKISENKKKFKMTLMLFQGLGGMIHEKKPETKIF
jgi:hypothetical protein